ncbi:MAG: hypothetical protein AB4368_26040 [Xenococcaceae cyanobacterium]
MIASDIKTTKIANTIEAENKKVADDIDRVTKEKLERGSSSESGRDNSINNAISEKNTVNNTAKDRKSKIMEHLRQSSNNFQYTSGDYSQRNQKIKEHLKKSLA